MLRPLAISPAATEASNAGGQSGAAVDVAPEQTQLMHVRQLLVEHYRQLGDTHALPMTDVVVRSATVDRSFRQSVFSRVAPSTKLLLGLLPLLLFWHHPYVWASIQLGTRGLLSVLSCTVAVLIHVCGRVALHRWRSR